MTHPIDPDGPASAELGLFGAECDERDAAIVVLPVPFDATTSYSPGTGEGPRAILEASAQVDLEDRQFGAIYERGLAMRPIPDDIRRLSVEALGRAQDERDDPEALAFVNDASERVRAHVRRESESVLGAGKVALVLGGEHSVPLGLIEASSERVASMRDTGGRGGSGLGILQIDAHMDLRDAYEGFTHSHASIMRNVLERCAGVTRLVQVGIRDFSRGEVEYARSQHGRVGVHFDLDIARQLDRGRSFADLCEEMIDPLPHHVHVSFDIDGLDPGLCPTTGTPVPGGLSFNQASLLFEVLAHSGRRVVSMDLVEVAPGADGEWDACVGARVLYKMCALARPGGA